MLTMKTVNHASGGCSGGVFSADLSPLVGSLKEISKTLKENADRPPVELRLPLPEIHNEVRVTPTPIEFHAPALENKVYVSPTPIEVKVEPAKLEFTAESPHIEMNLSSLVVAIYFLTGVIGVSAVGIITSLFLR